MTYNEMNNIKGIPVWEKYTLSINEAADYFNIGMNKLRKMANENKSADWVLWNNTKVLVKRKKFENLIDTMNCV